jgi:hypothetical protein
MPRRAKTKAIPKIGKAFFVKVVKNWAADTRLFRLEPKYNGHSFIVVVAAITPFGYEMIIYPSDKDGNIKIKALPGSLQLLFKDHERTLKNVGYEMIGDVKRTPKPKNRTKKPNLRVINGKR